MKPILTTVDAGVGTIKLNRPQAYNSVNKSLTLALQQELDRLAEDPSVRAIVITGEGKAFCAGQDLVEVTSPELNPGFESILNEHYAPIITRLRKIPKPIIAAVNGVAAGAGANIALACDIVIAKETASFIQAFSAIGLIPDSGGTYFLPRLIGFQKALAIAMLGDKVTAPEAVQMGMIYKYFPDNTFDEEVLALANKLAKMPTKGLALTKQAFNSALTGSLEDQLAVENKLQLEAAATEDYQEGVDAFLNKRKPEFKGK
ncbi:enoyl-CoA hydratase-related protein [Fulvivirgaceae bacterium BMA12]|uniref:Enoyl-CoA hydratase-related protein n=1 Tax=Agaribacillus aureus TaxID=3051825 RepID=A0ABT8LFQ4_9BACT|nr:enoyl-CoA hydratase-related protein [Fulvivirgaceae bacterium BMA12]